MPIATCELLRQQIVGGLATLSERQLVELAAHVSHLQNGYEPIEPGSCRDLLDEFPNLVWQFAEGGSVSFSNRPWREYFGLSQPPAMEEWHSLVHPEDQELFTQHSASLIAGLPNTLLDLRLLGKDGEYRWFSQSARVLPSRDGKSRSWMFIASDIHSLKSAEATLTLQSERIRLTVEVGKVGIWDYTPGTNLFQWDERCHAAFGADEIAAAVDYCRFLRGLHPEDSARIQGLVNMALNPQGDGRFEADFRTVGFTDGVIRHLHAEGQAFFGGIGAERKPLKLLGVLNDVTERVRAAEELRHASLDLQQFAYAAAHDLQEPVRNISLSLGFLKLAHATDVDEGALKLVDTSIEGARRIHGMITDLLAFARVTNPAFVRTAPPVDVNQVLKNLHVNLQTEIFESRAEIRSTHLPQLAVHESHLTQLFENIIGNALKYRCPDRRPVIEVSAESRPGGWQIAIGDNGIGFDEIHQERIFGIFKRLHHRHEYPGSGIGLAICSRIIAFYGGQIWARGKVNEGATLFFTLPG